MHKQVSLLISEAVDAKRAQLRHFRPIGFEREAKQEVRDG